jgi:diamine N-acetyltransferase
VKQLPEQGNIILRPLEPEDIDLLYQWENDMEIWEISNTRAPFSRYILAEYIKQSGKDIYETKQLRLIIETREGKPAGAIDLFDFDPYHQRAGVGILIHNTGDRRQGFASDALAALENYSLHFLGMKQLWANIASDNAHSLRLFEKAGFTQVGIKKSWLKTVEGWKDEILFQKLLA